LSKEARVSNLRYAVRSARFSLVLIWIFLAGLFLRTPLLAQTPLSITTQTLPGGVVGAGYSQAVTVSGGALPYTWSLGAGTLPAGLSLDGATGIIAGTPSSAGNSSFTVHVIDSEFQFADQALSIAISPAPLTITTTSLPDGSVGSTYSQVAIATGGTPPLSW